MMEEHHVWDHLNALAKPQRSLGRLEEIAVRLAMTQQQRAPNTRPRMIALFAGDHGCVADGVSAWPSDVTGVMVGAILEEKATSNALAAAAGCALRLIDVGVAGPHVANPPAFFLDARIADGTHSMAHGPAMQPEQFQAAWRVGSKEADRAIDAGAVLLIAGEMGIGNTTPAAAITALLADVSPVDAVGRGAGGGDAMLATKRRVVNDAVKRARLLLADDAVAAIAAVAGYEIAAMAGFYAQGARRGATLLLDGYVTTAAALIAERIAPGSAGAMIAGHRSAEPGHAAALAALGLAPILDWGMRLGEGSGALTALPLLDAAAALLTNVARLDAIGVARKD